MAGALAKSEGVVGVLAVLEGGGERAFANEARIRALGGGKKSWYLFSESREDRKRFLPIWESRVACIDCAGRFSRWDSSTNCQD